MWRRYTPPGLYYIGTAKVRQEGSEIVGALPGDARLIRDNMERHTGFIDIHAHLIPGLDDGPQSWDESLAMARMAVDDGLDTIIVTPHQLGAFRNHADTIRQRTDLLRQKLKEAGVRLRVFPGGDVRIEPDLVPRLESGEVMTLADGAYVLLELPHELYFPLEPVIQQLYQAGYRAVLSHPERNQGILADPSILGGLVNAGCVMQVTAGSLLGAFGTQSQRLSEMMVRRGLCHVVATDAHGIKRRRPLLSRAHQAVTAMTNKATAETLFCRHPEQILASQEIVLRRPMKKRPWAWLLPARSQQAVQRLRRAAGSVYS